MKYSLIVPVLAIGIIIVFVFFGGKQKVGPEVMALAACLRDKGAVMYGAAWCPHCKNEKNRFGDAFDLIPYVECPANPKECLAKGIEGYPTWMFPGGRKLVGEQGLERLAEAAGCPLGVK